MKKTLALIADWSGPFASIEEAKGAAHQAELGEVLYLAVGKCAYERQVNLQYVGVSNDPRSRFSSSHHRLPEIRRDFRMWVGQIASHSTAGRRPSKHPIKHKFTLSQAEWALAYFLALPLNKRKRKKPPPGSLVLLNRWFQVDFQTRRIHRPHSGWPDFIEYDQEGQQAVLVRFGASPRRLDHTGIRALALT